MDIGPSEPPPRLDSGLPPAPSDLDRVGDAVRMPRPTAWPPVLAFGTVMLGGGLLLSYDYMALGGIFNYLFCLLGALLGFFAIGGWVRNLRPGYGHLLVPLAPQERAPLIGPSPLEVEEKSPEKPQVWVTRVAALHPYSTGLNGGVWGGVAMALVAVVWSLLAMRSLWFVDNLLAAVVVPELATADEQTLKQFSLGGLLAGLAIHVAATVTTGIFLASTLPASYSRRVRILTGSLIVPVVWFLSVWWLLPVLSPPMARYTPWLWFAVSQIAYGIAAVLAIEHAQAPYRRELQEVEKGIQDHG